MGFDRSRAQFSEEQLDAAEKLDEILEAVLDGFQVTDIRHLGKVDDIVEYITASQSKGEMIDRILALVFILKLDNLAFADLLDERDPLSEGV